MGVARWLLGPHDTLPCVLICDLILETYVFGTLVNFLFYDFNEILGAHLFCVKFQLKGALYSSAYGF